MDFDFLVINFLIYSFIGYLCEVAYCSIPQRKLVNRGFLYGPYLPIYGFGALIVIIFLEPVREHWYLVFILGLVLTSTLEYFTSWALEKIFGIKLWDYSAHRININGRVCGLNSTLFGIMGLVGVYICDPFFSPRILEIPVEIRHFLSTFILVVLSVDITVSVMHLAAFKKAMLEVREKVEAISKLEGGELVGALEAERDRLRERYLRLSRHILSSNPSLSAKSDEIRKELADLKLFIENRNRIRAEYKAALKKNRAEYRSKRED